MLQILAKTNFKWLFERGHCRGQAFDRLSLSLLLSLKSLAQWIRLRLTTFVSCGPGFTSQANHAHFYHNFIDLFDTTCYLFFEFVRKWAENWIKIKFGQGQSKLKIWLHTYITVIGKNVFNIIYLPIEWIPLMNLFVKEGERDMHGVINAGIKKCAKF